MSTKRAMTCFLVASLLATISVKAQYVCEDPPLLWRNNNITCPVRAICADVFLTTRGFPDGTQCDERRVNHNCLCPGNSPCPIDDSAHLLYASAQQLQYTCRPVCLLPFCNNVRRQPVVSQTAEQNSPNFGDKTYLKMHCRCPLHHAPYGDTGKHRAVKAQQNRLSFNAQKYTSNYVCSTTGNEITDLMLDPCDN